MAKIRCLKEFNEQGLYIVPGVVEIDQGLFDYLLSSYPAYFAPLEPESGQSNLAPEPTMIIELELEPEPEPEAKDFEEPPEDKMMRKPRRRK